MNRWKFDLVEAKRWTSKEKEGPMASTGLIIGRPVSELVSLTSNHHKGREVAWTGGKMACGVVTWFRLSLQLFWVTLATSSFELGLLLEIHIWKLYTRPRFSGKISVEPIPYVSLHGHSTASYCQAINSLFEFCCHSQTCLRRTWATWSNMQVQASIHHIRDLLPERFPSATLESPERNSGSEGNTSDAVLPA